VRRFKEHEKIKGRFDELSKVRALKSIPDWMDELELKN
jgi:hypothetical protein